MITINHTNKSYLGKNTNMKYNKSYSGEICFKYSNDEKFQLSGEISLHIINRSLGLIFANNPKNTPIEDHADIVFSGFDKSKADIIYDEFIKIHGFIEIYCNKKFIITGTMFGGLFTRGVPKTTSSISEILFTLVNVKDHDIIHNRWEILDL